jgi:hypothetical protein
VEVHRFLAFVADVAERLDHLGQVRKSWRAIGFG